MWTPEHHIDMCLLGRFFTRCWNTHSLSFRHKMVQGDTTALIYNEKTEMLAKKKVLINSLFGKGIHLINLIFFKYLLLFL